MVTKHNFHDICVDEYNNMHFIDNYLILYKNNRISNIFCPSCHNPIYAKCVNNPLRRTHFAHNPNTSCSSINYSDRFNNKNSSPPTLQDVENLKVSIILYSYEIFKHINNTLNIHITINEFLNAFNSIDEKVYHYKNIPTSSFAYIVINQLKSTNSTTYLFSTSDLTNDLWEFNGVKDLLYIIDFSNSKIVNTIKVDYNYLNLIGPSFNPDFLNSTYSQLTNMLKLDSDTSSELLKIILSI